MTSLLLWPRRHCPLACFAIRVPKTPHLARHRSPAPSTPLKPTTRRPQQSRARPHRTRGSHRKSIDPLYATKFRLTVAHRNENGKVLVKKEPPSSPAMHNTRHRPSKLDLSASRPTSKGLSARPPGGPMTAREGVSMQDVGFACLSPGFQTHDPVMREQLQRSLSVRDQQRSIIEARLHKTPRDDGIKMPSSSDTTAAITTTTSSSSSKRRPPPGLSIVPPAASKFAAADERVIQSAPLNNTFTGLQQPQSSQRLLTNDHHFGSGAKTSNTSYLPANNNRLPPLSDVLGGGGRDNNIREGHRNNNNNGYYHHQATPLTAAAANRPPTIQSPNVNLGDRPREYRSAEEAVHDMSGGREELLPRIVHYTGHGRPVTPPSPHVQHHGNQAGRRRPRSEYELDNGSPPPPPLGHYRPFHHGPFGAGRDSPEVQRQKKDEFLGLCSRAWDLFHS